MRHVSTIALPLVALALSVAALSLSVTALASPASTTTLSPQAVADGTAYADALLARQPIPTSAQLVATLPTPLPANGGLEGGASVSSANHEYEIPLSLSVEKYVASHLPSGETLSGTETDGGSSTGATHYVDLAATCDSPHVTYCGVSYATADVSGRQELRVDVDVVWLPIVHVTMPTDGLVTVTGFDASSAMRGSSGPASVVLSTSQARQLSEQISDLKDMSQNAHCMEDSALLDISVSQNGTVVWTAIADECPGELRITGGRLVDDRSCAFWHVVNSFFPAGTATATKSDSANICGDTNNG